MKMLLNPNPLEARQAGSGAALGNSGTASAVSFR
jgi:hypothetical protein